jgi:Tfp pilus assembly protein PilV
MRNNQGQSLFEVVVALAIVAVILFTVVSYVSLSIVNASFARNSSLATRLSQEAIEWLRGKRDEDWEDFASRSVPGMGTTWCLEEFVWQAGNCGSDDFVADTVFKREATLIEINSNTVEAKVATYWTDQKGFHEAKSSTYFTNWRTE